ncbi:MAG: hypothetical protein Q9188_004106 [Gyalolechia gomerana]
MVTAGDAEEWSAAKETGPARPPHFSKTNEWIDLIYSRGHLIHSSTLTYAAFDTADVAVNITSTAYRTEPEPVFDRELRRYTISDYRKQLGQGYKGLPYLNDRSLNKGNRAESPLPRKWYPQTTRTQMGNSRLNISQAVTEQTERYLSLASMATEEEDGGGDER